MENFKAVKESNIDSIILKSVDEFETWADGNCVSQEDISIVIENIGIKNIVIYTFSDGSGIKRVEDLIYFVKSVEPWIV